MIPAGPIPQDVFRSFVAFCYDELSWQTPGRRIECLCLPMCRVDPLGEAIMTGFTRCT